jgi:hypothetical protein
MLAEFRNPRTTKMWEVLDLIRVFLPKLILEVLGAAGAMWGFFEVVGARRPSTVWFWRKFALIIGGLYFIRWTLQMIEYHTMLVARRGSTVKRVRSLQEEQFTITVWELFDIIRVFLPKVVLEIFGSAGAMWGFFEVVKARRPSTLWFWRPTALIIGGLYLVRWSLQIRDYYDVLVARRGIVVKKVVIENEELMTIDTTELFEILCVFFPKIVLDVFGSAGAMWGFFEVVGLRDPSNAVTIWRPIASTIGGLFLIRWSLQVRDHYHLLVATRDSNAQKTAELDDDIESEIDAVKSF